MASDLAKDDILAALATTHAHVIGSSGYGKSKFLEWLMRQAASKSRTGFCLIDWHGTLYRDFLAYLAGTHYTERPVYLLNPSAGDRVTGFNPFSHATADMSAAVSRRIDATVKPWGAFDTDQTPLLSRILRLLYSFAAEGQETLPNAYLIFNGKNSNLRRYAASRITDGYMRQQFIEFAKMADKDVSKDAGSTMNRLDRFLAPTATRRMLGRAKDNLTIPQLLSENGILLVNLGTSPYLTTESAKLIAALLLNEFREAALARAGTDERFILFLDEFQQYVTADLPAMLDQVRKGGLNLVLSHQHLGQLGDDETLQSSIATNARVKAVFGGLDYETAVMLAQETRLRTVNRRQVEKQIYASATLAHYLAKVQSQSTTRSQGWSEQTSENDSKSGPDDHDADHWSEGESTATGSSGGTAKTLAENQVVMPVDGKELRTEQVASHEEKLAREAFNIASLRPQELYLKLPSWQQASWRRVPEVETSFVLQERLDTYTTAAYDRSNALPPEEVDAIMKASQDDFFARAMEFEKSEKKKDKPADEEPEEFRSKGSGKPRSS